MAAAPTVGLWGRWASYADNNYPTGGNAELRKLAERCGASHTTENYTYSIPLAKEKLRMEFNIGLGWIYTVARHYTPTDDYTDIGGLDKQIQELQEAVVLPLTRPELFTELGIRAPKGILLYGPPGTGKTLLARACAKQTDAAFIKLSATVLDQAHIGEGSRVGEAGGGHG